MLMVFDYENLIVIGVLIDFELEEIMDLDDLKEFLESWDDKWGSMKR